MTEKQGSPPFALSWADTRKIAIGLGVAMAGAGLTYLSEYVSGHDFGDWTPIIVAVLAVASNVLRKFVVNTTRLAVLLALCLLTLPAIAADIDAPQRVDPYQLVKVQSKTKGKGYAWFVLGPKGFVPLFRCDTGAECVFTGAPGSYAVMLVVSTEAGSLDQGQATVVIGDAPPPTPVPPGPTPPGPTPIIPADRFDNVGRSCNAWARELALDAGKAHGIALDYSTVAARLAAGALPDITSATAELRRLRDSRLSLADKAAWDQWGQKVGAVWVKFNVAPKDEKQYHPGVIEFYNAVAAGLGAI